VQVRLFEVPRVDVDVEEVDPRHPAHELPIEHVEVVVEVHEDGVEHERLVGLQAVEGLAAAHAEGRVLDFAGVPRETRPALGAL